MPVHRESLLAQVSAALADVSPESFLAELMSDGPSKRDQALERLFAFCLSDRELSEVMASHYATRDDLQETYELLINAGAGQWAGRHYVPVAALGHPSSLDFVLSDRGRRDWRTTAILLIEYFERDETGPVPERLRGPANPNDPLQALWKLSRDSDGGPA